MNRIELIQQIRAKSSFLCVGLDPDPAKMPKTHHSSAAGVVEFCKSVIDATMPYCVAYKLNIAFFEALGPKAWDILYEVRALLPSRFFLIADAKRADIGNSSKMYARAFFDELGFDAVTVAPYMGEDSVRPFLEYEGKWTILLALTSNIGARDFQLKEYSDGLRLYEQVLITSKSWGTPENLMFVVGATQITQLRRVRELVPDHFLLVPGIGAQGGDLEDVSRACMTRDCGILVNSTRDIIYASDGPAFAEKAAMRAQHYQQSMQVLMSANSV